MIVRNNTKIAPQESINSLPSSPVNLKEISKQGRFYPQYFELLRKSQGEESTGEAETGFSETSAGSEPEQAGSNKLQKRRPDVRMPTPPSETEQGGVTRRCSNGRNGSSGSSDIFPIPEEPHGESAEDPTSPVDSQSTGQESGQDQGSESVQEKVQKTNNEAAAHQPEDGPSHCDKGKKPKRSSSIRRWLRNVDKK